MLPRDLLEAYIENFFGYGELSSSIWFIGMEEGGGGSEAEIRSRLNAWDRRGRHVAEDLALFHKEFGQYGRFEKDAPLQSTWSKIIRLLLKRKGIVPTTALLKQFQKDELGQKLSGMALLELLPLPKPARDQWPYAAWSDIPEMASIRHYEAKVIPKRVESIRKLIGHYQPETVIFYGVGFKQYWSAICDLPFEGDRFPLVAKGGDTLFMLLPHPVARGPVSSYYDAAGDTLHRLRLSQAQ
jgi:hypothetical protein